ncbi:GH25 family lysozyme [Phaeobacter porticola]|uniref:Lysozyme n=1 Tax=Phaeobacter porticola TaxID=1844006 RepID=A0A1L3I1E4_9RHOB|nr:GH25 family lysozyme [Phaeobacter porticola]APG45955.1 glycosyl hydrolase-like protein [Phaeobacter porticola]
MGRVWRAISLVLMVAACAPRAAQVVAPSPPIGQPIVAGETSTTLAVARAQLITNPKFADNDPHPWEGRTPWSYPIHGIDVSRWQGDIDWRRAKAAGISFAYIKATEGGDLADPKFRDHWTGARQAGVKRGAYHYFYFCRPAAEQARWFIRHVPRDSKALPHVLDMEWTPQSRTCTKRPSGSKIRAEADRFLDILEAHYGRRPVLYTTVDFYRDTGIGRLPGTEFWLRSVADHPHVTYSGALWRFWQYTGTGRVPGINGNVDLNVFGGGPERWLRWSGQI